MTATTRGINKMRAFERVRCGDLGPGEGATWEATMCPEINRYEELPSRPQGRAHADRRWPGRAIESRDSKMGHGLIVLGSDTPSKITPRVTLLLSWLFGRGLDVVTESAKCSYQGASPLLSGHGVAVEALLDITDSVMQDLPHQAAEPVEHWWRSGWVCPWVERASDMLEVYLPLPSLIVSAWMYLLLHRRISLSPGIFFVWPLSWHIFHSFCILHCLDLVAGGGRGGAN
jgi:hypothetical protein